MCTENSIVCGSKFIGQKVYLMSLNQPKQIVTPKKKKKVKEIEIAPQWSNYRLPLFTPVVPLWEHVAS